MPPSAAQPSAEEMREGGRGRRGRPRADAARREPGRPPRIGFLSDIPTPYRDPLLARLVGRSDLELDVTYCAANFVDRDWRLPALPYPARILVRRGWVTRGQTVLTHLLQPEIVGIVARGRYDALVVSSFAQPTSLLAIATARARGIPYMIVCESHARRHRSRLKAVVRDPLVRWVLRGASAGLAVGSLARDYMAEFGVARDRLFFFPNTPDVDWFEAASEAARPSRAQTRRELGTSLDAKVAIYVGRLLGIKGVDSLIAAGAAMRRRHPEFEMWIVGDGPERGALERLAARIESPARFLGFRQQAELPRLYSAADAFVLPSLDEPWGVVVNEAAASGLPLVTSDRVGAGADLVREGETGATFAAGDVVELNAALERVIGAPDGGRAMGQAARAGARSWGYDLAEQEFLRAVERVLRGRE